MSTEAHDPKLDRAREEAAGTDVFEDTGGIAKVLREAEDAQGVETFSDPDAVLPGSAVTEGPPGAETLSGGDVLPGWNGEDDREEGPA